MKALLSVPLLFAVGCASVQTDKPVYGGEQKEHSIQNWIPDLCDDAWETFDGRIAMDYGFGANIKFTDLFRIGFFDYADFSVVGVEKGIFHGQWAFPDLAAWKQNNSWDLSARFGIGLGGEFTFHTWELVDFLSSLVCLGYWTIDDD